MQVFESVMRIGSSPTVNKEMPTGISTVNPYITWTIPVGFNIQRFNVRITSIDHPNSLIVSGEAVEQNTHYQFPLGMGMVSDSWTGLCHVEVVFSEDARKGYPFEFTTGDINANPNGCFCFDDILENVYSKNNVLFNWNRAFDVNLSQTVLYDIQISSHPVFTEDSIFHEVNGIQADINDVNYFYGKMDAGTYYWRVRSYDDLDYSDWTRCHCFNVLDSEAPVFNILSVKQLENDNGDVEIRFSLDNRTEPYSTVYFEYSFANDLSTLYPCRIIYALHQLENGIYTVIWRSIRNVKMQDVNVVLYGVAYNGFLYSNIDNHEFLLKNKYVGVDKGGFTSLGSMIISGKVMLPPVISNIPKFDYILSGNHYPITPWYFYLGWDNSFPQTDLRKYCLDNLICFFCTDDNLTFSNNTIKEKFINSGLCETCQGEAPEPVKEETVEGKSNAKIKLYDYEVAWRRNLLNNAFWGIAGKSGKNWILYVDGRNFTNKLPLGKSLGLGFPITAPWQKDIDFDPQYYVYGKEDGGGNDDDDDDDDMPTTWTDGNWSMYAQSNSPETTNNYNKSFPDPNRIWYESSDVFKYEYLNGVYYYWYRKGGTLDLPKEDNGMAPEYTYNPEILKEDGYPVDAFVENPNLLSDNVLIDDLYVKKYQYALAEMNADAIYGYKDFRVIKSGGKWVRVPLGRRGVSPYNDFNPEEPETDIENLPITIAYPTYVPANEAIAQPFGYLNQRSTFHYDSKVIVAKNGRQNHFVGDLTSETTKFGHQLIRDVWNDVTLYSSKTRDSVSPIFKNKMFLKWITGIFSDKNKNPDWNPGTSLVKPNEFDKNFDYAMKNNLVTINRLLPSTNKSARDKNENHRGEAFDYLDFIHDGNFSKLSEKYFSGWSKEIHPDYESRPQPPFIWDQGASFIGRFTEIESLIELKIIYLQQIWDAFNTIHWQGNVSASTRFRLQYCQYYNETDRSAWMDLITKDSYYDENLSNYLIETLDFSTMVDTIDHEQFVSGSTYRLLLSVYDGFDIYTAPMSSKFIINHEAVNPVSMTNVSYNPWNKRVRIEFRIDDTQGDDYDITNAFYSPDGASFYPIMMADIQGIKRGLKSISAYDRKYKKTYTHTLIWNSSSYNLPPSNNYRIRLITNLSVLTAGADKPLFSWQMNINPVIHYAEKEISKLIGTEQGYVFDNETETWVELENQGIMPGLIDNYTTKLSELTDGSEQFYVDGELDDVSGYYNWLNEDVNGFPRSEGISYYQSMINESTIKLTELHKDSCKAQMITRRDLIRQGFYSNGGCDIQTNEIKLKPIDGKDFYYKVMISPSEGMVTSNAYNSFYDTYYELQLDFNDEYNSRVDGNAFRSIYNDHSGEPLLAAISNVSIQKSNMHDGEFVDKEIVNPVESPSQDNLESSGETGGGFDNELIETRDKMVEFVSSGSCMLSRSQLPGRVKNFYINDSYPSWSDTDLGITNFDGRYSWRVCAFNQFQNKDNIEQPRAYVNKKSLNGSKIVFNFNVIGNEDISSIYWASGNYGERSYKIAFSKKERTWNFLDDGFSGANNGVNVKFPTDRTYKTITNDENEQFVQINNTKVFPYSLIPISTDRTRPYLYLDEENHEYYLMYDKPGLYDTFTNTQSVLMIAMGKDYYKFGEYSQAFPYFVSERLETLGFDSVYSPCLFKLNNEWMIIFTYKKDNATGLCMTSNNNIDEFSNFTILGGFENCDHSFVYKDDDLFYLLYIKNNKIYYKTTVDFINYSNEGVFYQNDFELSAPSIVKYENEYILFFSEKYTQTETRISSVSFNEFDNLSLLDSRVELLGAFNGFAFIDSYNCYKTIFMYYNYYDGATLKMKVAVCNDRDWIYHNNTRMLPSIEYSFNDIGISKWGERFQMYSELSNFNINPNDVILDDVAFSCHLQSHSTSKWYKRKGSYVYPTNELGDTLELNIADESVSMSPPRKFNYLSGADSVFYSLIIYQYSSNGTNWHKMINDEDLYYRISEDGGLSWSGKKILAGRVA